MTFLSVVAIYVTQNGARPPAYDRQIPHSQTAVTMPMYFAWQIRCYF